jgi:hypothetical protein
MYLWMLLPWGCYGVLISMRYISLGKNYNILFTIAHMYVRSFSMHVVRRGLVQRGLYYTTEGRRFNSR